MSRVHIICEGQTEETFIEKLLYEQLISKGIHLFPSLVGKPGHKGGNVKVERLFTDIKARLLGDTSSFCTTFFDFYALPEDFPGLKEAAKKSDIAKKAACVQDSLTGWLKERLGSEPMLRFIPYVQMYEFEGLLFSNPEKLAQGIHKPDLAAKFASIREQFPTPEGINNDYETAPSKRIEQLCPKYAKPTDGLLAASAIGIDAIRRECALFNKWLNRIETLCS
ncbi:hypothetical protein FACS1894204_02750 [Synergistales bacterium]|nr:hypothetical protein FACS1894204_02750 [Synergistales bacterium]